jgi:hypothetical protein
MHGMPRFVILEHDHPALHWDLMLETGAMLRTWRLAAPPQTPGAPIAATALPDHRLAYLDYEGPVSGNRGTVQRWDAGSYDEEAASPAMIALRLSGVRVRGAARLVHVAEGRWRFEWDG